jgi:tRNA (cytidine/uridine-2'-O-)-methyltransferase
MTKKNPFNIVLVEPEIPPNTGNIARTCAATGTRLHLVRPLGFEVSDSTVRRAGLDYWPLVQLKIYGSLDEFMVLNDGSPMYFISTKGIKRHDETRYEDGAMFLFGKETAGLGDELLERHRDRTVRIPMLPEKRLRSLNLANSVAVILYEALRQRGYPNLL